MNLLVYSDESGVFDHNYYDIFVFGGLIVRGKEEKDNISRKYLALEKRIISSTSIQSELKAAVLPPKEKRNLFSMLSDYLKFGVVIKLNRIHQNIYEHKKDKQRYLDYAYKIGIKRALLYYHRNNIINKDEVLNLHFYCDEHTTATNGKYELKEGIEQELKFGTFNYNYRHYYEPIMPQIQNLTLEYRNSAKSTLIRSADIIANRIYYEYRRNPLGPDNPIKNCYITMLP